jgi:hypothetical protein
MKADFIAGFVKAAVDHGLNDDTIVRIFKRAMASPMGAQMFNQLPQQPPQGQAATPGPLAGIHPQQLMMIKQMIEARNPQAQSM